MANYDSLVIGGHIECLGPGGSAGTTPGMGTPSTDPNFPGVVFSLQPGYGLGEPQPTVDLLAPLLFDGERPWGRRASNRTIQLPIYVIAPVDAGDPDGNFSYLAAAVESLMYTCDADTFTIVWTRHQGGDPQPLPLVFDCFRAAPAAVTWGGVDQSLHSAIAEVTLNITALPYGRSDVATVIDFQNPITGATAPPVAVQLDGYPQPSSSQFSGSAQAPSGAGMAAVWDPLTDVWQSMFTGNGVAATAGMTLQFGAVGTVVPGQVFSFPAWVMSPQGWASGATVALSWYTSAAVLISTVTSAGSGALAANTPVLLTASGTAPATASYGVAACQVTGTPAATVQFLWCGAPVASSSYQNDSPAATWTAQNSATVTYLNPWGYTAETPNSPWSAMFHGDGATANPKFAMTSGNPVIVGEAYLADTWVMSPQGFSGGCSVSIDWYNGGSYLSSTTLSVPLVAGQAAHASFSGTAPATATTGNLSFTLAGTPAVTVHCYATGGVTVGQGVSNAPIPLADWSGSSGATVVPVDVWANSALLGADPGYAAVYAATGIGSGTAGVNIQGEQAITFWAGFGSSLYFPHWCRKGGLVTFAIVLTDNAGNKLSFSRVQKCSGSNNAGSPRWTKIRAPLPKSATFNYGAVIGYTITVTNWAGDLRFTRLYLADVEAVPPPLPTVSQPNYGAVYDLGQVQGSARAPLSLQAQLTGSSSQVRTFSVAGSYQWTCPAGVTSVAVFEVGGGGGGGWNGTIACGGGGSGGSGINAAVAVTAGNVYNLNVGAGGAPGYPNVSHAGGNGTASSFTGDSVTVSAPGGGGAPGLSTAGGTAGAAGSGGFAGAAGGIGVTGTGAGGGASSGGSAAAGNVGASGTTSLGGAAVTGGGYGGHGASSTYGNAQAGGRPGGGGGGGGGFNGAAAGGGGYVVLTYTGPGAMESLIAHRPGFYAPAELVPFVPIPIGDTPNGGTQYPVPPFAPGVNARFGGQPTGTYSVVVAPYSWSGGPTSASARTITVTVTQYEQVGGANYTATTGPVSITPNALYQLSAPHAGTGFARLGELTLPPNILPPDNTDCYFTVAITSSNTADRFQDILFLDTMGSTVIIESPTPYQQMFIEEPDVNQGYGSVMGTIYDRADAVSVFDRASISGAPLDVDPYGNRTMVVYSMEGNPSVQVTYFARYFLERPAVA